MSPSGRGMGDNPDVFSLSQIRDVRVDVRERKTEQTQRDKEGKTISYDPPRYTYTYDFLLEIDVDHPYIDDLRFQVNRSSVKIETGIPVERRTILGPVKGFVPDPPDLRGNEEYQRDLALVNQMRDVLLNRPSSAQTIGQVFDQMFTQAPSVGYGADPGRAAPAAPVSGRGFDPARGSGSAPVPPPVPAPAPVNAPAPTKEILCPYCMAKAQPDENGLCTYCGSSLI